MTVFHQDGPERGPTGEPLRTLQDSIAEANREAERVRSDERDAQAFKLFARRGRGVDHDALVGEVRERGTGVEVVDDIDQRRCYAEVDRWRANGGSFPLLREALGTREAATRAAMMDGQHRLRARFEEVERTKSALEKEVDRLRRKVASLEHGQDRVWTVMAERDGY